MKACCTQYPIRLMMSLMLVFVLAGALMIVGCGQSSESDDPAASDETVLEYPISFDSPDDVKAYLIERNEAYAAGQTGEGNVSEAIRLETVESGQHPYATVITCSDSRVPPEHVFNAGIGDLFVIRSAGNVIGDFELGSVEYGAEHLGTKLVVVLGHTHCGAVAATLEGGAHGYIKLIADEIASCLPANISASEAEILNIQHSIDCIMESDIIRELVEEGHVEVVGALYDIENGTVSFLS